MSIIATVTGIIIMLIKKIKRIPSRVICVLWIIPFLRMWIPVGMASKYSFMSLISKITTRTVTVFEGKKSFTTTNFVMEANSYFPITYKVDLFEDLFRIVSLIWIIVAIAILLSLVILYCITKAELRDAFHMRDNIYCSDKITSPAVYGIFRPRIILPLNIEKEELTYILAHENAHIKNADNLWRMIAFITTALHWFNPFAWVFLKNFLGEIELACDERVLAKYGEDEKKSYAMALVNVADNKNIFASAFGGAKIKVRIDNILSYKKLSFFSTLCFIVLILIIAYLLLTNAM